MNKHSSIVWMSAIGIMGIAFGVIYTFFGLAGFPAYDALIPKDVITS